MNSISMIRLATLALLAWPAISHTAELHHHLAMPETIHRHIDELGVSRETHREMSAIMDAMTGDREALVAERKLLEEKLAGLLGAETLVDDEIEATAEKLFSTEKRQKLRELEAVVAINRYLSAEQRAALVRKQARQIELRRQLEMKIHNIRRHISQEKFPAEEREAVAKHLESVIGEIQAGRLEAANGVLDDMMRGLGRRKQNHGGATPAPKGTKDASSPSAGEPKMPGKIATINELQEEIDALREEKIAWRGIEWKHCILEALAASRAENKPIIYWCHIDLPADDKRC